MHKVDPAYCKKYEDGLKYIRELEGIVAERKEKVGSFSYGDKIVIGLQTD